MKINRTRMYGALALSPFLLIHLLFYYLSSKRRIIKTDMGGQILKLFIYNLIYNTPYRNLFYYRIGKIHFLFSWLLPRCPYTKISQDMQIGENATLEHAFNTFLNAKSIGKNFTCLHNVTIGQLGGKLPTIGNNVTASCGASVLGDVVIGDNVVIGSYCVVTTSIPANCTVIGNPARIVRKDGVKVDINL